MRIWLVALLIVAACEASATVRIGNGGHVVVCGLESGKTYRLLDLFVREKNANPYNKDYGPQSLDLKTRVRYLISKLEKHNPARAEAYVKVADSFLKSVSFTDVELPATHETEGIKVDKPCVIRQAVVQIPDSSGTSSSKLIISRPIFNHLDDNERAALIVHEILTNEVRQTAGSDSKILEFTALIVSEEISRMSLKEYVQALCRFNWFSFEYNRIILSLHDLSGEKNEPVFRGENLVSAYANLGTDLVLSFGKFSVQGPVEFFESGSVRSFRTSNFITKSKYDVVPAGSRVFLNEENTKILSATSAGRASDWIDR